MDIKATLYLRNNHMVQAREAMGLSQRELADLAGVPVYTVQRLERFDYTGKNIVEEADRLACTMRIDLSLIVPDEAWGKIYTSKAVTTRGMPLEQLESYHQLRIDQASRTPLQQIEMRAFGEDVLRGAGLKEREDYVVRRRFGFDGKPPTTLQQVGDEMGICSQRVRQIEAKALWKIRMWIERSGKAEQGRGVLRDVDSKKGVVTA